MKVVRFSASRTGRLYLQEKLLVLIFIRGWVGPRAKARSEGNMSLKNPVTPPGIDPGTVRLLAQRLNHLTPNGHFSGRTAPLTSRFCILYIYSTNICTEYFKHAAHSPFFPLQNAVYFIMLPFLVPVLFTF